ncbi:MULTISPECIES: SWIM zinc finger family protein [unclassified Moraxella]|uniref:SWIM zinc finger family protein n=1 Tax=unclassified Moraxella TaxID=2685852 RepID=UPI003AF4F0B6
MPTLLRNFKQLFNPKIIERGIGYHKNGEVLNLRNDYDNHWTAIVQGNQRYRVEIELSKNGWGDIFIDNMDCTCEYEDNCKHQVAVLLKLQDQILTVNDTPKTQAPSLSDQLASFDKTQLIEFITYLSDKYLNLEQDWILWANKHAHQPNKATPHQKPRYPTDDQVQKTIQQRINRILTLDEFNDWEEFVFDEQSQALEDLFAEFQCQPHYLRQIACTWIDIALSTYDEVYDEVDDTLILCLAVLSEQCFAINDYHADWYQDFMPVTSQMDNDMIQQLSILADSWRQGTLRGQYTSVTSIERFWFDFLWSLNQQDEAMKWLNQVIERAEKYQSYQLDSLLKFKWQVLDSLGQDTQAEIDKHLNLPKIRQLKIDRLLQKSQFDEAIALINEGIRTTKFQNQQTTWYEQLVQIGEQINDVKLVREISEILTFNNYELNKKYMAIWKNTFDNKDWEQVRNTTQNQLLKAKKYEILAKFYDLEGQDNELVNLLKKLGMKYLIDKYADKIAKQDMTWLIDFYRKSWQQRIDHLSSRKEYQTFATEISQAMAQFPQGKSAWTASVQHWITQFSTKTANRGRKPALVEELSKILAK